MLAHANMIVDDSTRTGFDWGHDFGALTIGSVFRGTPGLVPVKEGVTPLLTIQLFRREDRAGRTTPPEPIEIPLPPDLVLPVELERTILWNGALATRAEVRETEMASAVPILMYHSIADDGPVEYAPYRTSTAAFRDQMRYLRRQGYHSVSLEEWVSAIEANRPIPGRPVIITFDDGYKDFLENALPILERSDFHPSVFVVTESVGGIDDWEPRSQPLALMSWADLREVMARGMNIGSHTVRHPDLLTVSEDEFRLECDRSAKRLWDELGRQPTVIAYPWGRSHPVARELLAEYGYRIALRSWGGASPLFDDPRNLSRVAIGSDTLESFIEKLRGPFIPDPDDYPLPPGWRDGVDVAGAAASDATDDSVGFADRDSVGFADRDS
ncbi:MAG: polysaccharide deacetylase family protein, partial [Methanobacterium sp.]|nr:polysaccharide deacetylase family protein [Methanobacterium sp.]